MNDLSFDVRVADIVAFRRRKRALRNTGYLALFVVVLWSVYAIVIADTDWDRYSSSFNKRDVMRKFNAVFLA